MKSYDENVIYFRNRGWKNRNMIKLPQNLEIGCHKTFIVDGLGYEVIEIKEPRCAHGTQQKTIERSY